MDIEKLGSYRIIGVLGTGAMGVVYKAIHEPTGKIAAVKVISADIAQRGKAYERFKREAEILQQFRHPNIVRILAVGKAKGTSYFAMEYIKGVTLDDLLKKRGELPWKEVVDLGKQMCDALHYAHEHGVVHRDLKPSNLMVTEDGRIKLTDFGIAKDLDATALTATGKTIGTVAYMAPEQIRDTRDISHKTDLYSLGIVFYQMLTGALPFEGNSAVVLMHAHINAPIPRASDKVLEIPKALDDLVAKMMAKEQADRPWDAAAVGETLNTIREKASKGQTVPMVWPTEGADPQAPTVGTGAVAASSASANSRPKKKKKRRSVPDDDRTPSERWRSRIGTAGLIGLVLLMGGLFYLGVKPYTEEQLYQKAEELMASEKRTDWMKARDDYLDELDRKFPDNPYKEQTRAWRDQLLLAEAEGRAKYLQAEVRTQINEPQNPNEERYAGYFTQVKVVRDLGDDLKAVQLWTTLANEIKPDESEENRKWHLFARSQAEAVHKEIVQRQNSVQTLFEAVKIALTEGDSQRATGLLKEIRERYGKYSDVRPHLDRMPRPEASTTNGASEAPEASP